MHEENKSTLKLGNAGHQSVLMYFCFLS